MQYCTRNPSIKKPELSDAASIIDINDNMDVIDGIICKNNFNGAVDPGTGDDVGDGYAVNSHWWNTTDHKLFVAESVATGAAIWRQVYPSITPATYDVIVYQSGTSVYAVEADTTLVDSGTVGTDDTDVINAAIAACPQNGTLFIDSGTYTLDADTVFYLNGGTSNPYWVCLPILNGKNIHIFGAGIDSTILKLANSQHDTDHPVAMILCRETDIADPGFTAFTLADMTLDGNKANQTKWYYDGAGLILTGSTRSGGRYYNLKLKNSHNTGIYLGNNGSGVESNSFLHNIYVENPYAEGIFLDSAQRIIVSDCNCIGDNTNGKSGYQVGLYVNGNTDYQTRSKDHILINNINCIGASVKFWCVNDCVASNIIMDTEDCAAEYGCLIHSCTGLHIHNSIFRSDRTTASSYGGATYIDSNSYSNTDGPTDCYFYDCEFDGYYGIHTLGAAVTTIEGGVIRGANTCIYSKDITEATTAITTVMGAKIVPTSEILNSYTGSTIYLYNCYNTVGTGTMTVNGTVTANECAGYGLECIRTNGRLGNVDPSLTYNTDCPAWIQTAELQLAMGCATAAPFAFWMQVRQGASVSWPLTLQPLGGRVGIGLSDPQAQLHVITDCLISGADYPAYLLASQLTGAKRWGMVSSAGDFLIRNATDDVNVIHIYNSGGMSLGSTATDPGANNLYVTGDVNCASVTDHTPGYSGDALKELRRTRSNAQGKIIHQTLPRFARAKFIDAATGEETEGRNIGNMVSVLTRAVQQLMEKLEIAERKIEQLEEEIQ